MLGDAREHAGAYLFGVVECKREIRPPGLCKNPVRAFLPFDAPAGAKQRF